ncbi:proliferating cell nuclear antigen (pcna) [Candidatus Woesearchaeota archaeon]|jgi:proliferating cell nuclear antigen|nr:proliferating cell nuclear antigen (pcna) [Candidatus Woesearchaeota archaeon]MBT4110423.1 proliferating cell nuclear antigen (pcna) [Candidatus Woesearchaeota archaeon]MBT4336053.1 proliferating cell nuclear antigen (pcna) [Candidatus Woesearchaeota archaeon]MBT4468968.1 proliferating cell nuclear antigen (pcna) [Candidatus Woesearchaeota archaeon]MBT6744713.1 proliferating cell nuclear antigen (pcna) [Candidatus Woesearchaeota archaeon]
MKLVLAEPKYFKDSISIISELVTEAKFKVNNNGLELIAMDPANVAMVIFKMLSSCFTKYEIKDAEEIAINLNNLKQILRRAKSDDVLTLETTEDSKLKIQMKSNTTRSFSIPTLDVEDKEQKVPELTFPISVEMNSGLLTESIEDVSVVSESVTFLGEKTQISVKAEGDLSKAFIEIKPDEQTLIRTDSDDKFKAKFSLEYLKKMITGNKLSDRVSLNFNTDYPMKVEYKIVDRLSLSFILAPRVDND